MDIIDGKKIAEETIAELKLKSKPKKFLAVVLVGEDPASLSFIKQKEKTAKELGIDFRLYKFSPDLKNDDLRKEVGGVANHKTCGGVIVQLPLPEHINKHYILNVIPREKDVDVLGERALGAFYAGRNPVLPPAVGVVKEIIGNWKLEVGNLRVAVVGRGLLVGKPIAVWLMDKAQELVVLSRNGDLKELKNADLVITGIGEAGIIKPEMLKSGAGVIDFGYSMRQETGDMKQEEKTKIKIYGDFDAETLPMSHVSLSFYTLTPGGTGPILVAKLFENFYILNAANR